MSSRDLDEVVNLTAQRLKRCRADDLESVTHESIAEKAGVSPVTAADSFDSKSALIVEICLHRIRSVSLSTDAPHGSIADRAHELIGSEIHRLIASAVGPGRWREVITTLELIFSGALIQAAAGAVSFQRAADGVQTAFSLILEGAPLY